MLMALAIQLYEQHRHTNGSFLMALRDMDKIKHSFIMPVNTDKVINECSSFVLQTNIVFVKNKQLQSN